MFQPLSDRAGWHLRPHSTARGRIGRRRILIVDDDRDARETLGALLSLGGHMVRLASDGTEALLTAREFRPEIVFLDIRMPRSDGYTVCRQLRESGSCNDASIYAMSALSGAEHEQRCSEAGFAAHFVKPVEPQVLSDFVS